MHPHDLEYLRQVSVPHIHLKEREAVSGELDLEITLAANAFAYVHIIYQY